MTGNSAAALRISNPSPNRGSVRPSWPDFFRSIFPEKTAPNVAAIVRTTVRSAEYVLAGQKALSARSLINALRSPIGPQVLDAIAGDAQWRACERRLLEIRELELELQNLEQKRSELMRDLRR